MFVFNYISYIFMIYNKNKYMRLEVVNKSTKIGVTDGYQIPCGC